MFIHQQAFSHHNKYTSFVEYANETMEDIGLFQLSYCKIKRLPKAAWVGENTLAYMRVMPYLVGSYLMNNKLCPNEDEERETLANLRCFLNAFQCVISILMSKKEVSPDMINDHMKLFMSSAHYLHEKYGKLNKKTKQAEGNPGTELGSTRKTKDFISTLTMSELEMMLREFGLHDDGGVKELRKKLRTVTKAKAEGKLKEWKIRMEGNNPNKDACMKAVLNHIEPSESSNSDDSKNDEAPTGKSSKLEKRYWNKGNWLSFLAKIPLQIKYLGPLPLIW